MNFAKGHGTENDFVIVEGTQPLLPEKVQALCDRRAGIGGDGVLRVIRAGELLAAGDIDELALGIDAQDWFMDYRNADGSVAEMCGNGTRVFAHWVRSRGLVDKDTFTVGTRAGAKRVTVHSFTETDAEVSVEMGPATVLGVSTASMAGEKFAGLGVDMGNPHLAAVIPGLSAEALAQRTLEQPVIDTEFFPAGVNVEIVTPLEAGTVHMRVFERGVGETRSCGTGTVAAARAALADASQATGTVRVIVPGGEVTVEITEDGSTLTGPSRIVATGETSL
ncbi:diaminopimelate epimerase [Corynebacterium minutissimum]|uniref:Diaminopimelate epimerase n=1 Tax=Corynebacterium minutissimum TaxID=38301 RepID=A0A376CZS0_9CORY|nr:diaminopimelate epimerase [Corynebacterium minutissimum]QRP61218.1 diaminopimelate epimerase [Corynebacterium minutissimum]STC78915.1 diaminopimelate epimerase [Corynebacterium minutissimum]